MSTFSKFFAKMRPQRSSAKRFKSRPMQPGRDWLIGILCFTAIVAGGSIASGLMFMRYSSTNIESADTEIAMPRYNQKQVEEALAEFRARKADHDAILKTGKPVSEESPRPQATTSVPAVLPPTPEPEPLPETGGDIQVE